MVKKCFWSTLVVALVLGLTLPSFAQESTVRGGVAGIIMDSTGAVVPGAKITLIGPVGTLTTTSDDTGSFEFSTLMLGVYSVRVEKQGFRVAEVKNIGVSAGRHSPIKVTLTPGAVTEIVEVSAPAITVDTASTSVSANLPDTLYTQIPVGRNVQDLFYISAGVAGGGGTGRANPSISGGSGLENLYMADGVNITDTSFGGLGVFNRIYGSVGSGINLAFVKEVQVKTGGYEAQYGRSTGGIVQIVTKSGSREYHGALTGFFAPQSLEATRLQPNDFGRFNKLRTRRHEESYDASAEFGGYVPGMREHLFFFASVDPTWNRNYDQSDPIFGLSSLGVMTLRTNVFNYSAKVTWRLSDRHTLESSIFGDPAHTSTGAWRTINTDNTTSFAKLDYGTRNFVVRYNGTLSPTWLLNASFTWAYTRFNQDFPQVVDGIQNYQVVNQTEASGLPGQRGNYTMQGYGFFEDTKANNYGFSVDTTKILHAGGEHSINLGYKLEKPDYSPFKDRSGASIPIPGTNASGDSIVDFGVPSYAIGQLANAAFSLRRETSGACSLCPLWNVTGRGMVPVYLRQDRGEFGPTDIHTSGTFHAAYATDTWTINKHITLNLGLRWEQQQLRGDTLKYTFTDNWSPRVGVVIDPVGNRNTKLFANFGRYNYAIPLDMAERSLSNELDFIAARWAPAFTTDAAGNRIATVTPFGGVQFVGDAAHLLTGATGGTGTGIATSTQGSFSGTGFAPGTKMEYVNEFVVGGEQRIWGGVIMSARYIDRRMPRIVEDGAGISPELYNTGGVQNYLIMNIDPALDLYQNEKPVLFTAAKTVVAGQTATGWPAKCNDVNGDPTFYYSGAVEALGKPFSPVVDTFGNEVGGGGVCFPGLSGSTAAWFDAAGNAIANFGGEFGADGIPDGFPHPVRNYQAVEIEFNKAFSRNWQMRANWRIAKLYGNFEGAFRNDNNQTDPSISSLFDFTEGKFGLLGQQFQPGYLNTDRRHIINGYVSYVFDKSVLKGLTLGTGIRFESGIPYNDLKAHPAYLNAGEIPVGGRGSLGRALVDGQVDVHADWVHTLTEKTRIRFGMDLFNLSNMKHLINIDQQEDVSFGTPNTDFKKPVTFQRPFYARFMLKFEF